MKKKNTPQETQEVSNTDECCEKREECCSSEGAKEALLGHLEGLKSMLEHVKEMREEQCEINPEPIIDFIDRWRRKNEGKFSNPNNFREFLYDAIRNYLD